MKISDSSLTNLFLSVWCVCVCICMCMCVCVCVCVCVLFTYTISIRIIYVSQEETSLIASNPQMNNLQMKFFKRKDIVKSKFLISLNYSFNHLFNH